MISKFTIETTAKSKNKTTKQMDKATSEFLKAAGGKDWECVEDVISPNPGWVPGLGATGENQGYKAYRKFINRKKNPQGGEIMAEEETPTPEEAPEEATPDAPEEEAPAKEDEEAPAE